ncbi:MAG: TetR/AcrR family transcriptional regulator [Acidimicrobiales bacterium]
MTESKPPPEEVVDGRRARRQRGRLAVTNAMIDLVFEGHTPPTADQVAARAGVSVASLFRYFDGLDDLREHAIERYFERFIHLLDVPDIGVGPLPVRIASLTAARVQLHETTGPMARLMRARSVTVAQLGATIRRLNATQADQIRIHFDTELTPLSPATREDTVATVVTLTSFESWDGFRTDHGRSATQVSRAWARALERILDPS